MDAESEGRPVVHSSQVDSIRNTPCNTHGDDRRATEHGYDGVPYADVRFDAVDWTDAEARDHSPAQRSSRGGGDDVLPEHATQAVFDPERIVFDARSQSGASLAVIGRSPGLGRHVYVLLRAARVPADGEWIGLTAWVASRRLVQRMWEGMGDERT